MTAGTRFKQTGWVCREFLGNVSHPLPCDLGNTLLQSVAPPAEGLISALYVGCNICMWRVLPTAKPHVVISFSLAAAEWKQKLRRCNPSVSEKMSAGTFDTSYFSATNARYSHNSIIVWLLHDLTPLVRFENHLFCTYVDITGGLNLRLVDIWAPLVSFWVAFSLFI